MAATDPPCTPSYRNKLNVPPHAVLPLPNDHR
jgi:hypothetical protein